MTFVKFVGAPRGHHGPYAFYQGFKFFKHGKHKVILLGEFFFVRISTKDDPCIGELQLLWDDRNNNQRLSSVRLYFLPEQTPDGRLPSHGEDEVVAASDKVVLKLEDLVSWITDEVEWTHGILAPSPCQDDVSPPPELPPPTTVVRGGENHPEDTEVSATEENRPNESADVVPHESQRLKASEEEMISIKNKDELSVVIVSFPKYCRLRAILKRLEGVSNSWLLNTLVIALGGLALSGRNTHVLFCRESFDHEDLAHHDLNCEHLAPILNKKKKKKQSKTMCCLSPGSESNTSEECKDTAHKASSKKSKYGAKQPPCKTEQEFLQRLFEFMKKKNTPIQRVPHLGFKQIDLFVFFTFAQKLGGYDKITSKKLWKHVYDELGGDPGSTSAATCTRRHYERLLLPFERFLDGKVCKPSSTLVSLKPKKKSKSIKQENVTDVCESVRNVDGISPGVEDTYALTDSNLENSKDSNIVEDVNLVCEEQIMSNDTYSEEESKTSWNIQKQPDSEDKMDNSDAKNRVKPIIIQKEQGESFSEKERKWNEIRRKNALARKWVRQLRPSRSNKTCSVKPLLESSHLPQGESFSHVEKEHLIEEHDLMKSTLAPLLSDSEKNIASNPPLIAELSKCVGNDIQQNTNEFQFEKIPSSLQTQDQNSNDCPKVLSFHSTSQYSNALDEKVKLHNLCIKSDPISLNTKSRYGYLKDSMPYQKMSTITLGKYPSDYLLNCIPSNVNDMCKANEFPMSGYHSDSSVLRSSEQTLTSAIEVEAGNDKKPVSISQRRPSVIQHTELVVSPSASQSPTYTKSENTSHTFIKNESQIFPSFSNCQKTNIFPNNFSHSIADKFSEWMSKAIPEAIACKTPSTGKMSEFHDQVLTPSNSERPYDGSSKVFLHAQNNNKVAVADGKRYAQNPSVNSKVKMTENTLYRSSHLPVNSIRSFTPWNQSGHFLPSSARSIANHGHHINLLPHQSNSPPNMPYFRHPKRHRSSTAPLPLLVSTQPSLHSSCHQMYRTSPHVDVPKTAPSLQYVHEYSALDLSVKNKAPLVEELPKSCQVKFPKSTENLDGNDICLDLSIKKKSNNSDNGIENITPPLPSSPNLCFSQVAPSLRPLPTAGTLHDSVLEGPSRRNHYDPNRKISTITKSSQQLPNALSSFFNSSTSALPLPANIHHRIHPTFINSLSLTAPPKDAINVMRSSKQLHSHFAPYVIPPFYSSNWTSAGISPPVNSSSDSQTSPNICGGIARHTVFPKHHPYKSQPQLYPVLYKDNSSKMSKSK